MKHDVLKLAKINSEQTVKLVEAYFNEDDFQETLIVKRFGQSGKYDEEQFNYLKTYLTRNEEVVTKLLLHCGESQEEKDEMDREKYIKYIELFTKLLCKLEKDEVEEWVEKPFFPPEVCLKVCIEQNCYKGVAILSRRSNRPLEAIQAYLDLLASIPINKLLE